MVRVFAVCRLQLVRVLGLSSINIGETIQGHAADEIEKNGPEGPFVQSSIRMARLGRIQTQGVAAATAVGIDSPDIVARAAVVANAF